MMSTKEQVYAALGGQGSSDTEATLDRAVERIMDLEAAIRGALSAYSQTKDNLSRADALFEAMDELREVI